MHLPWLTELEADAALMELRESGAAFDPDKFAWLFAVANALLSDSELLLSKTGEAFVLQFLFTWVGSITNLLFEYPSGVIVFCVDNPTSSKIKLGYSYINTN